MYFPDKGAYAPKAPCMYIRHWLAAGILA